MRNAVVRAIRTFAQTLAAGLTTLGIVNLTDIRLAGQAVIVMVINAVLAGLISFLQNVAEESAGNPLPK